MQQNHLLYICDSKYAKRVVNFDVLQWLKLMNPELNAFANFKKKIEIDS